jgi:hypothetical protein
LATAGSNAPRLLSTAELRAELLDRVSDPRAVPILARHAIPVIGVFVFDWSVLETIAALLLDALSTLWGVAGMGAYLAVRDTAKSPPTGVKSVLRFWASVVLTFVFVGGILSLFVIVPAFFLLPLVQSAHLDAMALVTSGWLAAAFVAMVVCQLPRIAGRIRDAEAAGIKTEKMGMDTEVGFIAHRTVLLGATASMLAIFGPYALHMLVIVAQVFGAGTEIMRDHYVAHILGPRRISDL